MVLILQIWATLVAGVMLLYAIRHVILTWSRLYHRPRPYYHCIFYEDLPSLSVIIPMHNEELVAERVLNALIQSDYPKEKLEIIPIDDHSEDSTPQILRRFSLMHSYIKPIYRHSGLRGKPAAINDALVCASYEIVLIFDADYEPPRDILRKLAVAFLDPEVGAVMGRVVPRNTHASLLARLLDLERSGGYQVDQQARYTLDLIPQYGGTVGGFRRSLALTLGGFDTRILAEDTDMTFRLYIQGWRVAYANSAECYEEVPETWEARLRQLRRWARGHTQAFFRYCLPLIYSPYLSLYQKIDGLLLLIIYFTPLLLLSGLIANLTLFLIGKVSITISLLLSFFSIAFNAFGNFSPFYQIGAASLLDGTRERTQLLPFLFFSFFFNTWVVTLGVASGIADIVQKRVPLWEKTVRFR